MMFFFLASHVKLHATLHQNQNAPFVIFLIQKDVCPWQLHYEKKPENACFLKTQRNLGITKGNKKREVEHAPWASRCHGQNPPFGCQVSKKRKVGIPEGLDITDTNKLANKKSKQTPPPFSKQNKRMSFCSPKNAIPKERKVVSANMFHG